MTIAIVGNSPILLDKEYGEEIDKHDIVVRFNDFDCSDKYIKHVGKKCTMYLVAMGTKPEKVNDVFYSLKKENRFFRCVCDNVNFEFNKIFNNKISLDDVSLFNREKWNFIQKT